MENHEPSTPEFRSPETTESVVLIEKAQNGNQSAYNSLFARYYRRVLRIVRSRMSSLLKQFEDPEDIVQNTFIEAIRVFDRFECREAASLINWFARLVENQILSAAKYHNRQKRDHRREDVLKRVHASVESGELQFEPAGDETGVVGKLVKAENEVILDECLGQLSTDHREVIVLRDYAGGSWEYIARELGRPGEGSVRELHRRAQVALMARLKRRIDF